MNLVPHRSRVSFTTFGKLPNGSVYWVNRTSGPFLKFGAGHRAQANVFPQTNPVGSHTAPTLSVIKEDGFFRREQS